MMSTKSSFEKKAETSGFIARTEEGVHKAARIVRVEAQAVEHIAQRVETLSATIEEDVDKVETFLHQVSTTANALEEEMDEFTAIPNGAYVPASNEKEKDLLALGWPWIVFHIFLIFLTLFVALLHCYGGSKIAQSNMELNNNGTSYDTNVFTSFSMLLINTGTILKALKFLRDLMSWQRKEVIKVEEDMHEIGEGVKMMAKKIQGVANMIENISHEVEREAEQIQNSTNRQVKST